MTWENSLVGRARRRGILLAILSVVAVQPAFGASTPAIAPDDESACGPRPQVDTTAGAVDYRLRFSDSVVRTVVGNLDQFHTAPAREAIKAGLFHGSAMHDISFELHHSPNHHEGLRLLLAYVDGGGKPLDLAPPVCFFLWARQFVPDDIVVLQLSAMYAWKHGKRDAAAGFFTQALALAPNSAELNYIAGLYYFEIGNHTAARERAWAAYAAGHPLPGLRNKLIHTGEWKEPPAAEIPALPSAAPDPQAPSDGNPSH